MAHGIGSHIVVVVVDTVFGTYKWQHGYIRQFVFDLYNYIGNNELVYFEACFRCGVVLSTAYMLSQHGKDLGFGGTYGKCTSGHAKASYHAIFG